LLARVEAQLRVCTGWDASVVAGRAEPLPCALYVRVLLSVGTEFALLGMLLLVRVGFLDW
jgi:hypothetical protein